MEMVRDEQPPIADEDTTEFIPTRASLLSRLKDTTEDESWREFFEIYWKLIYNTARRSGLQEQECQDVVQETLLSVSKQMPSFSYDPERGSFKGWLMQVTLWRIRDQFRKRAPAAEPLDAIVDQLCAENAFEEIWNRDWERNLVNAALERIKLRIDPATFQIFSLSVLQEKGPRATARLLDAGIGRVYMVNNRVSRMLAQEVKLLKNHPSCSK